MDINLGQFADAVDLEIAEMLEDIQYQNRVNKRRFYYFKPSIYSKWLNRYNSLEGAKESKINIIASLMAKSLIKKGWCN